MSGSEAESELGSELDDDEEAQSGGGGFRASRRAALPCRMAPLHSQGCEGAAYPRLDTRLQSPEKTITNWFLFLFYHPKYYLLGLAPWG